MADQPRARKAKPPGDMLTANLLALLKGWQACGYQLMSRLEEAGLGNYNSGTIYRNLRQMEKLGLVSSMWDTSEDGPARRIYSLTAAGSLFLSNWVDLLENHRRSLAAFIDLASGGSVRRRREQSAESNTDFEERQGQ